jgi:ribosomal protein S18 acetylase RimI-like enzyme
MSKSLTQLRPIQKRPIKSEDHPFLYEVFCSTRPDVMEAQLSPDEMERFLRMQFQAQHNYYQEAFPDAQYCVLVGGDDREAIGRLYVDHRANEVKILDIALLPKYRCQGIGSAIVQEVLEQAHADGKPVRIHVELNGREIQFYERLGFVKIGEIPSHQLMESVSNQ